MNNSKTKISSIMCNRAGKANARVLATTPRRGWKSLHFTAQCVMLVSGQQLNTQLTTVAANE